MIALVVSLFFCALARTFRFVDCASPKDVVPSLCHLVDQPMYCRCDNEDLAADTMDVSCYATGQLTPDHVVFRSFQSNPSVISLKFNTINLEHGLRFVPTEAFKHSGRLERLKLSESKLGVLKRRSFYDLPRLTLLSLDSNSITALEEESIASLPHLKTLELGHNQLQIILAKTLVDLPALTHLFIERNEIWRIEDLAFAELTNVEELDLSHNNIQNLTDQTFKGLSKVTRVDLFRNKIQKLDARVFKTMPSLVELDLKYNGITDVDPLVFDGLPQLRRLYLSHNHLRTLPAHLFMGAPNLLAVDLSQNDLITLTWRVVQDLRKINAESFDLSLIGNRFICNCRLTWMLRLQKAARSDSFRRELRHVKCRFKESPASPNGSSLRSGTAVTALSLKELDCPEEHVLPPWQSGKALDRHGNSAKAVPTTSESLVAVNDADGDNGTAKDSSQSGIEGIEVNGVKWAITHQRAALGNTEMSCNREKNCAAASCYFMYEALLPLLLYFSVTVAQTVM